jgi:hypothetical protein
MEDDDQQSEQRHDRRKAATLSERTSSRWTLLTVAIFGCRLSGPDDSAARRLRREAFNGLRTEVIRTKMSDSAFRSFE